MKSVGGGVHQLRRKVVFSVLYVDAARVRAAARLRERRAATSMVICARERVRREKEPKERRAFAWLPSRCDCYDLVFEVKIGGV